MDGITNLNKLLKEMKPEAINKEYVFCTLSENRFSTLNFNPLLMYKEKEGITVIVEKHIAIDNSLDYSCIWKLITLTIHSDLLAIGFLAKITDKLAKAGISVNVISAYYHDHLFVPTEKLDETMNLLKKVSESS